MSTSFDRLMETADGRRAMAEASMVFAIEELVHAALLIQGPLSGVDGFDGCEYGSAVQALKDRAQSGALTVRQVAQLLARKGRVLRFVVESVDEADARPVQCGTCGGCGLIWTGLDDPPARSCPDCGVLNSHL